MKIRLFSGEFCPYCKMAKKFLKENKVEFEEIDVQNNHEMAMYMVEKTQQQGIPVIEIIDDEGNSEFIIGFNQEKIKEKLKLK